MKKLVLIIALLALVGLLSASVASADPPIQKRTITLESQGWGGSGLVRVVSEPNSGSDYVGFEMRGIPRRDHGDAWSLGVFA